VLFIADDIQSRVHSAGNIQYRRFARSRIFCNAQMHSRQIRQHYSLDEASRQILKISTERLGLSARAYNRILKIARTIADLEKAAGIESSHILEAIQLRTLDRGKASVEPYSATPVVGNF
jgi:magnesium chelatase family protein